MQLEFVIDDFLPIAGVYEIKNKITEKIYIGQSISVQKRIRGHIKLLEKNQHSNQLLQKEYNDYGRENFVITIIKIVEDNELLKVTLLEQESIMIKQILVDKRYNVQKKEKNKKRLLRYKDNNSTIIQKEISLASINRSASLYGKKKRQRNKAIKRVVGDMINGGIDNIRWQQFEVLDSEVKDALYAKIMTTRSKGNKTVGSTYFLPPHLAFLDKAKYFDPLSKK